MNLVSVDESGVRPSARTATLSDLESELLAALKEIADQYDNQDLSHVDFRVEAKVVAENAIALAEGRVAQ